MVEEQRELRKQFQEKARDLFNRVVADFFEMNPAINLITWTQATPYFNDGEPCEFSVHYLEPMTKELYDEWAEEGGWPEEFSLASRDYVAKRADGTDYSWNDCPWELPDETWTQEEINNAACIRDINNKAMEHIFLAMFGDHVQVVATREGFDTSEFSHD